MRAALCLLPLTVCITGCGTMCNLSGRPVCMGLDGIVEPRVFGGVKNDLEWGWPFLLELPFSAVSDTLTIPSVLHKRRNPSTWKKEWSLGSQQQLPAEPPKTADASDLMQPSP
jgi:uncharacterized protein YceK